MKFFSTNYEWDIWKPWSTHSNVMISPCVIILYIQPCAMIFRVTDKFQLRFSGKKRREFILTTDPISLCFVGSWADFSKIRLCIAATCMGRSTGQGWKPLQHTMFDEGSIRFTTWWCTCSRHVWCGRACGGRSKMHAIASKIHEEIWRACFCACPT